MLHKLMAYLVMCWSCAVVIIIRLVNEVLAKQQDQLKFSKWYLIEAQCNDARKWLLLLSNS